LADLVTPLAWNVPIVDPKTGFPTRYFTEILQAISDAKVAASLIDAIGGDPGSDQIVTWDDGVGDLDFKSLSEVLDFIGSTAHGDILYRDSASWARLPAGTAGKILTTNGASADPTWETPVSSALTLIEQKIADGTQNAYTFSSIPGTYEDLILVVYGRSTSTSGQTFITVNGLTTSIYDRQTTLSQGATVTSSEGLGAANWGNIVQIGRSGDTAGFAAGGTVEFLAYAKTVLNKVVIAQSRVINNASSGNGFMSSSSGQARLTSAITSITITANAANNFATGSLFTLYGRG
jgi:hypothetical protein